MNATVEIENVIVIRETDEALLCVIDGPDEVWIPKSVVGEDSEVFEEGDEGTLVIQQWFAEKEGLV